MEPARDVTERMEGLTIKPKAPALTPSNTIMESTHEIAQEMEDMTLNPKARVDTPLTAITSSHAQRVFSQQQPQSSPPAPFIFAGNPTGGYVYTTTSAGLNFSNPNASGSSSTNITDTSNITTTTAANQFQAQDLCDHLLKCDDPVGFLKYSLYHSHFPSRSSLSHTSSSASNRITKSRSTTSSPRERHHHRHARHMQPGIMTPTMGTTVYKARIKKVPGTKTIYTTTAEEAAAEEKEKEKERMTRAFVEDCLERTTKARVAAERDAARGAAHKRQMQMQSGSSGMSGACGKASRWFLRVQERAKRTWVNEEGNVVEESWVKTTPPMSLGEISKDFEGMDDVEKSVWEEKEEDEMME